MADLKPVLTTEDADAIRGDIEAVYDGWYAEGLIDWDDFLGRLEDRGYDLGGDLLGPAIKRIKAIVRDIRKEAL